jgi:1-aminocyclopropane-1-carboxylate deaminase/D-cysteine desulfhydrase-like pyridoxal-dependent ACC family enzyme
MGALTYSADDLTPWELRGGAWYKREDLHRNAYGVNGAKFRACRHLIASAVVSDNIDHVVTAQSVKSPQAAIVATLAEEMGLGCTVVVGASKPETAVSHPSIRIAVEAGASLDTTCRVAYNGVIQPYAAKLVADRPSTYQVPYAISPPPDSSPAEIRDFLAVGGHQVLNLPDSVRCLVIAFGSGNTTAGVLYGLATHGSKNLERLVLVGVGPDRTDWLRSRLQLARRGLMDGLPFRIDHYPLHGWFAEYSDRMHETVDGLVMHPTYEGKMVRFLNSASPPWWTARDGSTGVWIVGGPF